MRRLAALVPVALFAAACGGSSPPASTPPATTAAPATTQAPAAKPALKVSLTAESHNPVVGRSWTYEVRVTDPAGKPVACTVHLQFLFAGSPVGELGKHKLPDGVWKETIPATGPDAFPPAAVGHALVVRALASAPGYKTGKALWPITVKQKQ